MIKEDPFLIQEIGEKNKLLFYIFIYLSFLSIYRYV